MTESSPVKIEEKRVKSTIIRRRAKVEPPAPPKEEAPPETPIASKKAETPTPAEAEPKKETPPVQTAEAPKKEETGPGPAVGEAPAVEKERPKKPLRRKSRDELEMEMIARAGGLKKAADLIETAPERLERVFKPERSSKKRKVLARKEFKKTEITTPKAIKRVLRIEGSITISDLSHRMSVKGGDVLKKLMGLGMMATINQTIDADTVTLLAHDFGFEVENVAFTEASVIEKGAEKEASGASEPRSPIVTVMGHVDHGKTSILDAIRKTRVAEGEAGGITQHIGAYDVTLPKGSITFIDTPGHEAFTSMRARGAQVTDIVILVVAADDGVMPQTVEAINHAKAAKVPIIVAVNKIDKPQADSGRVERGLMEHGLVSEKLGGETIFAPVSAKTGQGVEELLEMILLQAEVLELKANKERKAIGTIIEARLDKGRGPVATVVVREGTLRRKDVVVAGTASGKVRALIDASGREVEEAGPSKPVEVLGLSSVPLAGDMLHAMGSGEDARQLAEHREGKARESRTQMMAPPTRLEDLYARAAQELIPELRVIIKGDVQGSSEALSQALIKLSGEKARISVLHTGVGSVTESDVMLAIASGAIIIGFNVRPDSKGRELAEREKVEIRTYSIIYEVVDDIKKAMEGMLKPIREERYLGRAEVRQAFAVSKIGTVAGCAVVDGKVVRSAFIRVLRDGKIMHEGKIGSLKRFKDDAREVAAGLECGIGVENYNDVKPGDLLEAFEIQEIAAKL